MIRVTGETIALMQDLPIGVERLANAPPADRESDQQTRSEATMEDRPSWLSGCASHHAIRKAIRRIDAPQYIFQFGFEIHWNSFRSAVSARCR